MDMDRQIGRRISMLSNQIKRYIDNKKPSTAQITGVQGRVLHFILAESKFRDLYQKDIEEEFNLRRSSATGILQALEKQDMIRRTASQQDARLKKIVVTKEAEKIGSFVERDLMMLEEMLTLHISKEDLDIFCKVADRMLKNFE